MEQHPIPRQITTFEFKLIGFMTLKQFIYLVVFIPLGFIVFKLFPLPLLNILLGLFVGFIGVALAFLPYNDRPLDHWIVVLFKKLSSPTQYFYHKENEPLYFLKNLYFVTKPHIVLAHVEAKEKLAQYLGNQVNQTGDKQQIKQGIYQLLFQKKISPKESQTTPVVDNNNLPKKESLQAISTDQPFIYGTVKSNKLFPLPGILIYVKNDEGKIIRLLKSNNKGLFASFKPFPAGEYIFEAKDPSNNHFFDTMKIRIENTNPKPIEIFSQRIL